MSFEATAQIKLDGSQYVAAVETSGRSIKQLKDACVGADQAMRSMDRSVATGTTQNRALAGSTSGAAKSLSQMRTEAAATGAALRPTNDNAVRLAQSTVRLREEAVKFSPAAQRAAVGLKEVDQSARRAAEGLDRAGKEGAETARQMAGVSAASAGVVRSLKEIATGAAALGVAYAVWRGFTAGLRESIAGAVEAESAFAQLEAGVRSTGGAAGFSAQELADYSTELQRFTGVSDEAIQGAQAILLTFTNISGDIFPRATRAILDLSARMGGDLSGAATLAGKALNEPAEGLSALSRWGVQFSESQELAIKQMVKAGDVAGAQTVILAELERQFGGSARAARETLGGSMQALSIQIGDLAEMAGGEMSPALKGLSNDLAGASREGQGLQGQAENLARSMGQTAGAVIEAGRWILSSYSTIRGAIASALGTFFGALASMGDGVAQYLEQQLTIIGKVVPWAEWARRGAEEIADFRKGALQDLRFLSEGFHETAEEQLALGINTQNVGVAAQAAAGALAGLKEETQQLSAEQKKAVAATDDSIAVLRRAAEEAERMRAANAKGPQQGRDEALLIAQENAVRQIRNALLKAGLDLSVHEVAAINESVAAKIRAGQADAVREAHEARTLEMTRARLQSEAELQDAISGTRDASMAVTARIQAEDQAKRELRENDESYIRVLAQQNLERAKSAQAADYEKQRVGWQKDHARTMADLDAQLADAINRTSTATYERAEALEVERRAAVAGLKAGDDRIEQIRREVAAEMESLRAKQGRIDAQNRLDAALDAVAFSRAEGADFAQQAEAARRYGADVADILAKYGLLSDATRELGVQEQIRAAIQAEGLSSQNAGHRKRMSEIEAEIRGNDALTRQEAERRAQQEIAQRTADHIREPLVGAVNATKAAWEDWLVHAARTGEVSFKSIAKAWLDIWIEAMARWLARWLATIAQGKAAEAALGSGGGGGGGGGWMQWAGKLMGGSGGQYSWLSGSTPAGSNLGASTSIIDGAASGGSGNAALANSLAGWALAAYGLYVVYKGFIEDRDTRWAYASTRGASDGNNKGPKETVRNAIKQIVAAAEDLAKQVDLAYEQVGDVTFARRGKLFEVRIGAEAIGRVFEDFNQAAEYATVQALRTAELSGNLSDLVRTGIRGSKAETRQDFAADVEFVRWLEQIPFAEAATGAADIAQQMRELSQTYDQHLAKVDQLYRGTNQYQAALENLSTWFQRSAQGLRDQILGVQRTEAERIRAQAEEYNRLALLERQRLLEERRAAEEYRQRLLRQAERREAGEGGPRAGGGGGTNGGGQEGGPTRGSMYSVATGAMGVFASSLVMVTEAALGSASALATAGSLVGLSLAEIEARIATLNAQIESLAPISEEEIQAAIRRAQGAANEARQQQRQALRDQLEDLRNASLSEPAQMVAQTARQIRDWTEAAREAGLTAAETAEGVRLLGEALGRALRERIAPLLNRNYGLPDFVEEYRRNQREIEAQRRIPRSQRIANGGPRDWELNDAERNNRDNFQFQARQAIDAFAGLSGGMAATLRQADGLRRAVREMGLSAEETDQLLRRIDFGVDLQRQNAINSIMDRIFGYLRESGQYARQAAEFERQKVNLEFMLIEAELRAWNAWTEEAAGLVNSAREIALRNAGQAGNASRGGGRGGADPLQAAQEEQARRIQDLTEEFKRTTESLRAFQQDLRLDDQLSGLSPQQQLAEAERRYREVQALALGGDVAARGEFEQVARAYLSELRDFGTSAGVRAAAFEDVDSTLTRLLGMTTFRDGNVLVPVNGFGSQNAASGAASRPVRYTDQYILPKDPMGDRPNLPDRPDRPVPVVEFPRPKPAPIPPGMDSARDNAALDRLDRLEATMKEVKEVLLSIGKEVAGNRTDNKALLSQLVEEIEQDSATNDDLRAKFGRLLELMRDKPTKGKAA